MADATLFGLTLSPQADDGSGLALLAPHHAASSCGTCASGHEESHEGMATQKKPGAWRAQTLAVRGGQVRSPFQETAEGLFLTSGYAYENAEEAEARFKGKADG